MTAIHRCTVEFVGSATTGSSTTSFYSMGTPAALQSAVKAWASTVMGLCPPTLSSIVPTTGETIEDTTGDIIGSWSAGTFGNTNGSGAASFAAGVGVRFVWETGARTRNRPCRGTNFLVPVSSTVWDADGTMTTTANTAANGAAANYVTAIGSSGVVWTRPRGGAADGGHSTIISGSVPDKVSWLRSRRT